MTTQQLKKRTRQDYGYLLDYRTRWSDNDMYDHMNNSIYNFLYDSICNTYLIKECGLHPPTSEQYGLIVHSHSNFFGSIAFPAVAELGLRVNKLGKTSVTWEVGLFEQGVTEVKAVAELIHVFIERNTGRPAINGMNQQLWQGLEKLRVPQEKL